MLPGERLFAFLDDVYVVCAPERVSFLHSRLRTALWDFARIRIHAEKTQVWIEQGRSLLGCQHLTVEARLADPTAGSRGIRILGIPLGHSEYVVAQLQETIQSTGPLLERIPALTDLQSAWLLLLFLWNVESHSLRVVHPCLTESFATQHDAGVWQMSLHSPRPRP